MIDAWLSHIAELIGRSVWMAPLLALLAGVLTSATPCALTSIPLIVGYVGGAGARDAKNALACSAVFSVGTAATFVTLGVVATSAGKLMGRASPAWFVFLGVLTTLMALQTWGIFNFIPSVNLISKSKKKGLVGAFLAGVLGGVFSSPCATPTLIALLAIIAGKGNLLWGILLMFLYSMGHSILVLTAGVAVGFVQKINGSERYKTAARVSEAVMGTVILLVGLYMFWLAF